METDGRGFMLETLGDYARCDSGSPLRSTALTCDSYSGGRMKQPGLDIGLLAQNDIESMEHSHCKSHHT